MMNNVTSPQKRDIIICDERTFLLQQIRALQGTINALKRELGRMERRLHDLDQEAA